MGDLRGFIGASAEADARNFFVFDMTFLPAPITSATLSLDLPPVTGFFTGDASETYKIFDVSTPLIELIDGYGGYFDAHTDLGTGTEYGSHEFLVTQSDTQINISLNSAAIADMNAAIGLGMIGFGGAITTLDQFPNDEFAFGFTSEGTWLTQLILDFSDVDADFNNDQLLDCLDVDALVAEISSGTNAPSFDLTGDSLVDQSDLSAWLADAGAANLPSGNPYLAGDANLDGNVDVPDFNSWNSNKFTANPAWCGGDFNADGVVDVADFNQWNGNKFTASAAANVVPEPTSWLLILAGAVAWLVRRRTILGRRETPVVNRVSLG